MGQVAVWQLCAHHDILDVLPNILLVDDVPDAEVLSPSARQELNTLLVMQVRRWSDTGGSRRGLTGRRRSPMSWMGKPNSTLNKGKWIKYSLNQIAMTVATLQTRHLYGQLATQAYARRPCIRTVLEVADSHS